MTHRILVTRPAAQADELARLLRARGLTPVVVPTVAIDAASTTAELDAMLESLEGASWLVFTCANGA
jgi:uroporphyrinogen III methyltransferase/synthase